MAVACQICGAVTQNAGSFREEQAFLPFRKKYFCHPCWSKRQQRDNLIFLLIGLLFVMLVPFFYLIGGDFWPLVGWTLLNLLLLGVFFVLMILVHEMGHASCAFLLGWRVFGVILGIGPTIAEVRLRSFLFEVKAIPLGGMTLIAPRQVQLLRLKSFVCTSAGPLTNFVLLVYAFHLGLPRLKFSDLMAPPGFALQIQLALANLLLLISNLLPMMGNVDLGFTRLRIPSDGLALLTIPFMSKASCLQSHAAYFLYEALQSFEQRSYEAAKNWHLRALDLYPDDISNRMNLGLVLVFMKDLQGARNQWLQVLNRTDQPPANLAAMRNNIAWTDLLIGGEENLQEADSYSQLALEQEPWSPVFRGGRGCVLIEKGDVDQGLPLVREAFDAYVDPRFKAICAGFMALGEIKQGKQDEGRKARDIAYSLDPDCQLIDRVDKCLKGLGACQSLE